MALATFSSLSPFPPILRATPPRSSPSAVARSVSVAALEPESVLVLVSE